MLYQFNGFSLGVDYERGLITSLIMGGKERLSEPSLIFRIHLRDRAGGSVLVTSCEAGSCQVVNDGAIYGGFSVDISARVFLACDNGEACWRINVTPKNANHFVEWVEFLSLTLPRLVDNNADGTGGKILFPYNEGVLISDMDKREDSFLRYRESEYPSKGFYTIFPNMVFAQMLAYVWADAGLYIGAHDKKRGVKDINFLKSEKGVILRFKLYCGVDFGESFSMDYPIVISHTKGKWEAAAERYRRWFEKNLPQKVTKISENEGLPEWYSDAPLVVSYPVRGLHDMDEMKPNKLFPYTNALPILEKIKKACDSRLLVLLMHWEGTAPWAPPYVWPPYGSRENFYEFREELHNRGDLMGVYCSGFGYTLQSNLIEEYNKQDEYEQRGLWRGMCAGADGKVALSNICTGQRSGYDICPASDVGKVLLREAYEPLLTSGIDYAQILDQNHGGGQYFCYSKEHGHAPAPGPWMTENMQNMLGEWSKTAEKTLLGCESAASEPFIGDLLFSDNRFELNYFIGVPIPLYSYIYHQYLRNFMGNQVCCPFPETEDTLRYRMAYSFSAGDCMTLVLTQEGDPAASWGQRDFSVLPDKQKTFRMIGNLSRFYREKAKSYLYDGRMIEAPTVTCATMTLPTGGNGYTVTLPTVLSSAWESVNGERAVVLVNPAECEQLCSIDGNEIVVPPLDAVLLT